MYRKELAYYFSSPIAYIVIGLYLVAMSLFLWVIPGQWNIVDSGYAQVDGLFQLSPWLLLLLCPAITMRLIAEERQMETWDILCVRARSMTQVILGKYFAAWTLTAIALLPCIVHFFVVYAIAEPYGNLDGGAFATSMLGLLCLSAVFTAVGLLASAITRSQIVAFILGSVANFILYWVTLQAHYESISRGVLDISDLVFFLSVATLALLLVLLITRKK